MNQITVYLKGLQTPICFEGEYLKNQRSDISPIDTCHYYIDKQRRLYTFRKENILCVISKKL